MALLKRWNKLESSDLASNLASLVNHHHLDVLVVHPFKRGSIWRKACKLLGKVYDHDKDAFLYFAAFYSNAEKTKELFCQIKGLNPGTTNLELPGANLARFCVCGLPENEDDATYASALMTQCSCCKDWFHDICVMKGKKLERESWTCNSCNGQDVDLFVPKIFKSSYLERRQITVRNSTKSEPARSPRSTYCNCEEAEVKTEEREQLNKSTVKFHKDEDVFTSALAKLLRKLQDCKTELDFKWISQLAMTPSHWNRFVVSKEKRIHKSKASIKNQVARVFYLQKHSTYFERILEVLRLAKVPDKSLKSYKLMRQTTFYTRKESLKSPCNNPSDNEYLQGPAKMNTRNYRTSINAPEPEKSNMTHPSQENQKILHDKISPLKDDDKEEHDLSEDDFNEDNNPDVCFEKDEICKILIITESDLSYRPPASFTIALKYSNLSDYFDLSLMRFKGKRWGGFINEALLKSQFTCSFNARTDPAYSAEGCRIYGYCSGDCEMTFSIHFNSFPEQGKDWMGNVRSYGAFCLIQERQTGRKVSALQREQIAEVIKNGKKPYNLFLTKMHEMNPLQILHRNVPLRSKDVLRKIKAETTKSERLCDNSRDEMDCYTKKMKQTHNYTFVVPGYIQFCNLFDDSLAIQVFDENTLQLHSTLLKQNKVELRFDATGKVCRNRSGVHVYLYEILAVVAPEVSFPLGLMLSEKHNHVDISYFLKRIKYGLNLLHPELNYTPLAPISVCDFSFALIHSLLEGGNNERLRDYLQRSWRVLNNEEVWSNERGLIYICTSHFIKAVQRNLTKKIQTDNKSFKRSVIDLALFAAARLVECESIEDFKLVSFNICYVFGKQVVIEEDLDKSVEALKFKPIPVPIGLDKEPDPVNNDLEPVLNSDQNDQKYRPIRHFSQFYSLFREIQNNVEHVDVPVTDSHPNPYYCETVLKMFEHEKIALWPMYSAALPKLVYDPDFTYRTNAAIESDFSTFKNSFQENNCLNYADVTKELVTFYNGRRLEVAEKYMTKRCVRKLTSKTHKEEKEEKWKRGSQKRKSKYFTSPNVSTKRVKLEKTIFKPKFVVLNKQQPPNQREQNHHANSVFRERNDNEIVYKEKRTNHEKAAEISFSVCSDDSIKVNPLLQNFAEGILNLSGQIPWAGSYRDGDIVRSLSNTCPFDSHLFTLYVLWKLTPFGRDFFQTSDRNSTFNPTFSFQIIFDLIDGRRFDDAKSYWLREIHFKMSEEIKKQLSLHRRIGKVNCHGTEDQFFLHHVGPLFKVKEVYYCSNSECRSGESNFTSGVVPVPKIVKNSVIESITELTQPQFFTKCCECGNNIMKKFIWNEKTPLPFFPIHGLSGFYDQTGVYVPSSTESDIENIKEISFCGKTFLLFAYHQYAYGKDHFYVVFNTLPAIQHDGMIRGSKKCKIHVPEKSALSSLWYVDKDLFTKQ